MAIRFLVFFLLNLLAASHSFGADGYMRFTTTLGNIDVKMFSSPGEAPNTVANFQSYITSGAYTGVIINRSVPSFVIQAGFCSLSGTSITINQPNAAIASEAGISNTQGTISMALSAGPDTGTNQWFFNTVDNSAALDGTADGGPFTVFGVVANQSSLAILEEINSAATSDQGAFFANLFGLTPSDPEYAFFADNFSDMPLINYTGGDPQTTNLILVNTIAPVVLEDFPTWQSAKFTSTQQGTPGFIAPAAIPWNDGIPNLLKYLCNIDPSVPMTGAVRANLPTAGKITVAGTTYETLTYHQFAQANGVKVNVQTSPDLQTWTTLSNVTVIQTGSDSANDPIVQVQVPMTGTTEYIRLNVTQP